MIARNEDSMERLVMQSWMEDKRPWSRSFFFLLLILAELREPSMRLQPRVETNRKIRH